MACRFCGAENREEARFCDACGAALEPPAKTPAEERKVVSVLFGDLVGFTEASETADPEDVRARLRPFHELLRERIEAYGGTVEKFIGDAVMAVFGAPQAHEDDAERAVRAGLAILEALAALNAEDPALSLAVRIGINTGEALVELEAHPEHGEGFVTGDVVNTAARIQSAAPVGGVAVGEDTFRATEPVFEWERLPAAEVKGKAEPVALWRPLAARARFGSDLIRRLSTPLVGRELDVLQLRTVFEKAAREPAVQLVTIVGEPGVGKSRLVAELGAHVDSLPELVRWRQGRSLPYGEGVAFWALGEMVKAQAGIYESDPPDEAERKLERVLPQVDEAAWLKACLLPLLGIDSGSSPSREESFTAWRRFLESIAERTPAVLVFEDLHWADDPLLDFLEYFADWAQGVPLLVVCTARPELYQRRPAWGAGLRNATTLSVFPLSASETATLVSALLEQAVLPAETQQAILERAGGNPLYAEEFVRMLRDRGLVDGRGNLYTPADVPFPDSLQALIAARLDTLPGDAKSLLQDAAVLGKVFWSGAVTAIGERDPVEVERILHELARKELVRPARQSSMQREHEFGFWHVLVRDVAYGQIPRAQRAAKHLAAARWIEEKAGERVEDLADVLAYHTGEALSLTEAAGAAGVTDAIAENARRYALLAGERTLGLDTTKAVELFERALQLTPESDPSYPHVLSRVARAGFHAGRVAEANDAQARVVALFRERGDTRATGAALTSLNLFSAGVEWETIEEAIALLEQVPPGPELVLAYEQAAGIMLVTGNYEGAVATSTRALELARELSLPVPARTLGFRGSVRCNLGDRDGLAELEQARELLLREGHGRDAVVATHNLAIAHWTLEGSAAALPLFEEARALATTRGLTETRLSNAVTPLYHLVETGRLEETIALAADLHDEVDASQIPVYAAQLSAAAARAFYEVGDPAAGAEAERGLAIARGLNYPTVLAIAAAPAALCAAGAGDAATARALLAELLDWPERTVNEEYLGRLPALVRCALVAGDDALAARLVEGVSDVQPLYENALVAARAQVIEAEGDRRAAETAFGDAARRWEAFGSTLEQAYALLGAGRCLAGLGDRAAEQTLRRSRALFDAMGARPRIAECDGLLSGTLAEGA